MSETRIALLPEGLKENELHLLKTICVLSEGRGRGYAFECASGQQDRARDAIWVVDASARAAWTEQHGGSGARAVIVAPAGTLPGPGEYVVRRPMTPSRLLAALDAIAEGEMGFLGHVVIGGAGSDEATATTRNGAGGGHARHTALVVDDSTTIQKQIEVSLRAMGIAAVCVDSGDAALNALNEAAFDIIFLDVILEGDADGYQICKSIRRHRDHRRTPVVMLTSRSSTFDRVRGSMAGCDTYLTKPVDAETFKEVVEKYLPDTFLGAPQFG